MRTDPRQGAALIIVLCFVALLTVVVVAFLTRSQTSLRINNSRAAQSQVDMLARSVVNFTTADLRQEIAAGSRTAPDYSYSADYTSTGTPIYVPRTNAACVPSRTGLPSSSPAPGSDPLDNVVKISKSGVPFFPSTNPTIANPALLTVGLPTYDTTDFPSPDYVSTVSTSAPSLNGRYIEKTSTSWSATGWDKPQLIDTTAYPATAAYPAGLQNVPVPDWIYVTSTGRNKLASPLTPQTLSGVVGRYAYVIYDEGGLLDANVAGYPSSLSRPDSRDPHRKGSLALADLTQLPGGMTSPMQDAFIAWRNQGTTTSNVFVSTLYPTSTAPDYLKFVLNGGLNKGFTSIYPGDQKLLSRQDLLAYSAGNPGVLPAQTLAYLTSTTRALNAPTWTPTMTPQTVTGCLVNYTNFSEKPESAPWAFNVNSINTRWPATVTITRPKLDEDVDANATTVHTETVTFNAGDPVVQHRFPLSKISLLSNPNAASQAAQVNNPGSVAWAVQYYFGLQWVLTDSILQEPHWEYTHGVATGTLSNGLAINSLVNVAALSSKREPDFFELLSEGVLRGSINDALVLDMGASLIDQFDADDIPTAITNVPNSTVGTNRLAFGKENLPYFSQMLFWPYRPKSDPTSNTFEAYLIPMFWNPHRNSSSPSSTVTNFQMTLTGVPGNNTTTTVSNAIAGYISTASGAKPVYKYSTNSTIGGPNNTGPAKITFNTSQTTNPPQPTYQEPTILANVPSAPLPPSGAGIAEAPDHRAGFYLGSISAPDSRLAGTAGQSGALTLAAVSNYATAAMLCSTDSSTWHTYEQIGEVGGATPANGSGTVGIGSDATTKSLWIATENAGANGINATPSWSGANALTYYGNISQGPVDPRVSAVYNPSTASTSTGVGGVAGEVLFATNVGTGTAGSTWQPTAPEGSTPPSPAINSSAQALVTLRFGKAWNTSTGYQISVSGPSTYLGRWNENAKGPLGTAPNYYPGPDTDSSFTAFAPYVDFTTITNTPSSLTGDYVLRPGDGVEVNTPTGAAGANPMALAPGNVQDRPIILNRPFRSVGEMGYAYRGLEWKTIDFSTPVSGDAGLLDLFSIGESEQLTPIPSAAGTYASAPLTAGVVNINTRHPEVLQALLNGSIKNDLDTQAVNLLSSSQAQSIAQGIVAETSTTPLLNRSEIASRLMSLPTVSALITGSASPYTVAKPEREAVVRALAEPADTRTWNLLIDLDVQAGRYPTSIVQHAAANPDLSKFDVQGERRCWVHLAIDRYTGKVISEQLEVVHDD